MSSDDDISRCFTTLVEMMQDRGHDVTQMLHFQANELKNIMQKKQVFSVPVTKDLHILFYLDRKKLSEIKKFFENAPEKVPHYIVVFKEKANNLKNLNDIKVPTLQIFEMKELLFNVSRHVLVPKHTVIKSEQVIQDLLEKYNIKTRTQLPHILRSDPMAKYLGLSPGDVVMIKRVSPTAGLYMNYRCCV